MSVNENIPTCTSCRRHVMKTYITRNPEKILYLLNLSQNQISQLTYDELLEILKIAQNGINVCERCKNNCVNNLDLCQMPEGGLNKQSTKRLFRSGSYNEPVGAVKFRIDRDKETINKINTELNKESRKAQALQYLQNINTPK